MAEHRTLAPRHARNRPPGRTRGVLFVHSAPRAIVPHVEWAVGAVLGHPVTLEWRAQPVLAGQVRAEATWSGPVGTASRLVSALRAWDRLRVEVTEDASEGHEGERYAFTPALGIFRAAMAPHGGVQVGEERLRAALERAGDDPSLLDEEVRSLLGEPWDAELEPFRVAGDGVPVRWLHPTG